MDNTETRRCVACGRTLKPGDTHVKCPVCRKKQSERSKEDYIRYKAEHRCTECGRQLESDEARTVCPECLQKRRDKYKQLRDSHICAKCRKPLPDGYWYVTCDDCRAKDRERHKRTYAKRERSVANKPMPCQCGSKPVPYCRPEGWRLMCETCNKVTRPMSNYWEAVEAWNEGWGNPNKKRDVYIDEMADMEISPCPWCGSAARAVHCEDGLWRVLCTHPTCINWWADADDGEETREEAIKWWNELADGER